MHFIIEPLEARIAPANVINVASLDGSNGFKMNGVADDDFTGTSVDTIGDINGDTFADVVIGAQSADPNGPNSGSSFVVFGKAGGAPPAINLSALNGTDGFRINGGATDDGFGSRVSAAGDINGDGFADLIVGAPTADVGANDSAGAAYVIFGHTGTFPAVLEVSALNGTNGFKINGLPFSLTGYAVSGAGDVNNDSLADLVVGAFTAPGIAQNGAAYVLFGHTGSYSATFDVSAINGSNGFRIDGEAAGDNLGASVRNAGDVNGDGIADIILGATQINVGGAQGPGRAYVVFGHGGAFSPTFSLSALNGANGFRFTGLAAGDFLGFDVSGLGDVNADGFDDVTVGASGRPGGAVSYVVFGRASAFAASFDPTSLTGTNGFTVSGTASALRAAGDVNGDGIADFVTGFGGATVVYGKTSAFPATLDVLALGDADGLRIIGGGGFVGSGGDVNKDGFDDVVIGSPGSAGGTATSGAAFVVFGRSNATPPVVDDRVVTFTDSDGDLITIKTDRGTLKNATFTLSASGEGAVLTKLDLTGAGLAGGKLTISAKPQKIGGIMMGDGKINVGQIDASGLNLGKVKISGDVNSFMAGSGGGAGVKSLKANSLGVGQANFPGQSPGFDITGGLGALKIPGDVLNFAMNIGVGSGAGLGAMQIGGQISGSTITVGGILGSLKVTNGMVDSVFKVGQKVGNLIVLADIENSTVNVGGALDSLIVGGSIVDSTIHAPGVLNPSNTLKAKAIGIIGVKGDVLRSQILAGYDKDGLPVNADAGIGSITIKGALLASDIVAGILDATLDGFGRGDTVIPGGSVGILATIASITVKGAVSGSFAGGDFFGITAQQIKNAKIGGSALALTPGADDLLLDGASADFRLVEVV